MTQIYSTLTNVLGSNAILTMQQR